MSERKHRLWGYYVDHVRNDTFVLKTLHLRNGEGTSYQRHNHRSELWTVMQGRVRVWIGELPRLLYAGDQVFVPMGVWHSMQAEEGAAIVMEHQVGFCHEDDIERRPHPC